MCRRILGGEIDRAEGRIRDLLLGEGPSREELLQSLLELKSSLEKIHRSSECLDKRVGELEMALLECEQSSEIIECSDLFIVGLDPQGRITLFNRGAEKVTALPAKDVMGTNFFERFVVKTDKEAFEAHVSSIFEGKGTGQTEAAVITRTGDEMAVQWGWSVVRSMTGEIARVIAFGHDVSYDRWLEEQMLLMMDAIESSNDGIAIFGKADHLLFANPTFLDMFGCRLDDARGRHYKDFLLDSEGKALFGEEGSRRKIRTTCTRKDGSTFPAAISFAPITGKDGKPVATIAVARDVSQTIEYAANQIRDNFAVLSDKDAALQYLHRLTSDEDNSVRGGAAIALGAIFPMVLDRRKAAWQDLHRLTSDKDSSVRGGAAIALGAAFPAIPDKDAAWQDLHRLTGDKDAYVRGGAAIAFGAAFPAIPDKDAAWQELHRLTGDKDAYVRGGAAYAFGVAFPVVPDKDVAWKTMVDLSEDHGGQVRVSAYHSLGRASIFKATETESEEEFRRELENALQYFERSAEEAEDYNPAKFCLPFYRSFYVLTFKSERPEIEVEKYLKKAKDASEGSKNKEDLLEAVENLANALKEAQNLREKSLHEVKRDLRVYSQYCNHFAELLDRTEDQAPRAVKLLRIGGKLVDKQIKGTIIEIQEIAKELCKMTVGTEIEPLGREVIREAREISTENYLRSENSILRIAEILEEMCNLLHPQKRDHASKLIKEINICRTLECRIITLEAAINYIQPNIDIEMYGKQFDYIKSELDEIKLGMKDLQQKILDRLDENEKAIISAIIDQSNQQQMDDMLDLVKQVLSAIQHQELRGTVTPNDIEHLSKVVDDTRLKAADKLKVTLPLIPYLLQYEHEITLETGGNLSVAWDKLVRWSKGRK